MKFKIYAQNPKDDDDRVILLYDNETNFLSKETGFVYEDPRLINESYINNLSLPFSKENPLRKFKQVRTLKIQLGLSCNYSCSYCSQRFVERSDETSKKDVDGFMAKLESLEFIEKEGLNIEIWGGEPLVYIKTIMPLVAALKKKFASWEQKPRYGMITNGSLLTDELCDWLHDNQFSVAVSHDGPAQHLRGPDPFEDPELKAVVLRFYRRMKPQNRISFNAMLNASNTSRKAIYDWFVDFTGDPDVILGEGGLIDAYDTDGLHNSLTTKAEHFAFRNQAFKDIYGTQGRIGFHGVKEKIDSFTRSVLAHKSSNVVGQKCGMDDEHTLAVDLRGNVLTCQNVSAVSTAMNGMPHLAGNIVNMDAVQVRTGTHWRNRPDCAGCPVLHLCQGACLYLEGKYWEKSCKNSYSDNVALMALSIEKMTGYIPYAITADHLPLDRQDIWGTFLQHEEDAEEEVAIAKIVQQKTVVEDVEVFTSAKVMGA